MGIRDAVMTHSAEAGPSGSHVPVIDRDHLKLMTGGDAGLAEEVIGLFQEQVKMWRRLLSASHPQESWADAAHSIKGSAVGIGASALARACARVETLGRSAEEVSKVRAGVALAELHDVMNAAVEAAAKLAHEFALRGEAAFSAGSSASKASNS